MQPSTPLLVAMAIGWTVFGFAVIILGFWSIAVWIETVDLRKPWPMKTMYRLFTGFFVVILPTLLLVLILMSIAYSQLPGK